MQKIIDELTRINRKFWINPLSQIINNYEGYQLEPEHSPNNEILTILQNLKTNDLQLDLNAIFGMESLNCFAYRAYSTSGKGTHYWNPLSESYPEFIKTHSETKIEQYQVDSPYPSSDIIRRWFAERFKYSQVTKARANFASEIAKLG